MPLLQYTCDSTGKKIKAIAAGISRNKSFRKKTYVGSLFGKKKYIKKHTHTHTHTHRHKNTKKTLKTTTFTCVHVAFSFHESFLWEG